MPKRRNQKKAQVDSDEEPAQTAPKAEEESAPIEPSAAESSSVPPAQAEAGSSAANQEGIEVKKEPTPPVHVLYCESK